MAKPQGPTQPTRAAPVPVKQVDNTTGSKAVGSNQADRGRSTSSGGGKAPKVSAPPTQKAAATASSSESSQDKSVESGEVANDPAEAEEDENLLDDLPSAGTIVEVSRRARQRSKPFIEKIDNLNIIQVSVNVAAPFDSKIDRFPYPRRPASSQSRMRLQ
jgi:hypothetical protein